ncbi:MAG: MFS transporter [Candidatus Aenigmarchaeota archaeon]|nr:MFS transporter [Candidatus Aenigmarchaeota archaeon]
MSCNGNNNMSYTFHYKNNDSYKSTLNKFYIANTFGNFWFILPIIVLFLQAHDISYFQIGILEAVNILIIILLELPTGAFADLLGRRNSVVIGCALSAIAMLIIGLTGTFLGFLIGYAFWAAGDAFVSGAWQALLFDKLKEYRKQKNFLKIIGRIKLLSTFPLIIGLILGPLMFSINIALPWIVIGIAFMMSGLVYLSIKEIGVKKKITFSNHLKQMKDGVKYANQHKEIKWMIIFALMISVPMFLMNTFILQPYVKNIVVDVIYFSIIFPIIYGLANFAGAFAYKFKKILGLKTLLIFTIAIEISAFILMSLFNIPLILIVIVILYMNRDVNFMIAHDYINHRTRSNIRATVLSYWSLLTAGTCLITGLFVGYALDIIPMNAVILLLAIIVLISGIVYFAIRRACHYL